jgi:antitoxin ParD1/3/4
MTIMSKSPPTPRLTVSLSPALERRTRELVETGLYQSASEVVRDALRRYFRERDEREQKLDALRKDIRPALDQLDRSEGVEFSLDEFLPWAEQRFEEQHDRTPGEE